MLPKSTASVDSANELALGYCAESKRKQKPKDTAGPLLTGDSPRAGKFDDKKEASCE